MVSAGKGLTAVGWGRCFVVAADFFGINTPVVIDFQAAIIGALSREMGRHTEVQMVFLYIYTIDR